MLIRTFDINPDFDKVDGFDKTDANNWRVLSSDILEKLRTCAAHQAGARSCSIDHKRNLCGTCAASQRSPDVSGSVARVLFTGTHMGTFRLSSHTLPPSSKSLREAEILIFRIADGKIVESWATWDRLNLLQQLGVVPAPEQGGS